MSRRLPASLLLGVLLLGTGVSLLVGPASGFGERTYESNPVISTSNLDVFSGQSVAQSFVATHTYGLLRVTLRLQNTGSTSDLLNVSIRPDDGARPSATVLASTEIASGSAIALVNVAFAGEPVLAQGARYWIVARHGQPLTDSYRWYRSADNQDSYPDGWAMTMTVGFGWSNTTFVTDMYFSTWGRELDANVTVGIAASRRDAMPGDEIPFTVYYNNTGTLAAQRVWVNHSLPAGLTYVSDTASGSSSPFPAFTFDGVPNGVHGFTVTFRVEVGVEPGSVLVQGVVLAYANATGAPRTGSEAEASVTVGIAAKQLYLVPDAPAPHGLSTSRPTGGLAEQVVLPLDRGDPPIEFDLSPPLARAFRAVDLDAVLFLDSEQNRPEDLNVAVTLADWNGVSLVVVTSKVARITTNNFDDFQPFLIPFAAFDHTFAAGHQIRVRVSNLGNSTGNADLAFNSTFADSHVELATPTYVRVDALQLRDLSGPATTWTAMDGLAIRTNVSDPFGSADILASRVRITAPSGGVVVDDVPMALLSTDASSPSVWRLYEYVMGPALEDGTYRIEVTGVEINGVVDVAAAAAEVSSPDVRVTKVATAANVRSGDRFFYEIWVNDTGLAPTGTVWVNDTLPSEVLLLADSDPANRTGPSNWTWAALDVGSRLLSLDVEVRSGIPQVPFFGNQVRVEFVDAKGHPWPAVDVAVDVVLNGPVIALAKSADRGIVHAGELVTFTVSIANAGEVAPVLWLNDTLPSGLGYVSNTAGALGGTVSFAGGVIQIRFTNLTGGTAWSFELVALAAAGLSPGTNLTNAASLAYTNANGALMPTRTASASVTAVSPRIGGTVLTVEPAQALAGDPVAVTVDFANTGNEPTRSLWLNLSLDASLTFLNASRPASVSGGVARFVFTAAAVGTHRTFLNASIGAGALDGQALTVGGTIEYEDANGNALPRLALTPDAVVVVGPRLLLGATPGTVTVEAGETLFVTVTHTNAGSGTAGDVWLNLSLPASFVYVGDTADGQRTVSSGAVRWQWQDRPPGVAMFTLELRARPTAVDGAEAGLLLSGDYTDENGNLRTATPAAVAVTFAAPVIDLQLVVSPAEALPGTIVRYELRMENTGSSTARTVWLLDAVDGRFEVVQYASSARAEGTSVLNWTYADVEPGQVEIVTLDLRVRENVTSRTPVSNVFEAYFTNGAGTVIGYVRSDPQPILVVSDTMTLLYVTLGGLALAGVPLAIAIRRRGVNIEEVFLVYRDGVLMYHLSRTLVEEKDEDVLSGMLTAVQEFVRDAFRYGEHRELHQLDFGDYRILIERGKLVYLAVVYAGRESASTRRRVRSVLDRIELTYGDVLERWDGDMERVTGARDVIRDHLLRPNGRRSKAMKRA